MMNGKEAATKGERSNSDDAPAGPEATATATAATALAFDIDEQPVASLRTQRLTERTDLPITGLPRPEGRRLPIWARLKLLWHRQILRHARH